MPYSDSRRRRPLCPGFEPLVRLVAGRALLPYGFPVDVAVEWHQVLDHVFVVHASDWRALGSLHLMRALELDGRVLPRDFGVPKHGPITDEIIGAHAPLVPCAFDG